MNDREATRIIEEYFSSLFMERDVDALDRYLHPDSWDSNRVLEPCVSDETSSQ